MNIELERRKISIKLPIFSRKEGWNLLMNVMKSTRFSTRNSEEKKEIEIRNNKASQQKKVFYAV